MEKKISYVRNLMIIDTHCHIYNSEMENAEEIIKEAQKNNIILILKKDFEKHSAVISYFRKEYIKTQLFPVEASRIIGNAFDLRNESDYRDWCEVSQEEAEFQLQSAEKFLEMTKEYLDSKDVL